MKPVFFTDRDLGTRFPEILRQAGLTVERHGDHFAPDARDVDWIPVVAERRWIILSNDKGIHRKPEERDVVMGAGVALFIVVGGHAQMAHLATNFVNTYSVVEQFIEAHKPPYVAKVYRPSPVTRVAQGSPGSVVLKWPI